MDIKLTELSTQNGAAEYVMLQDMEAKENGFTNEVFGLSNDEYLVWLTRQKGFSLGEGLPDGFVPQTVYFLYVDGAPVGMGRIRHRSSEYLESIGVNGLGYGVAKSFRGKGYGKILFGELLKKCKKMGYESIKLFPYIDNAATNKIMLKHGARHLGVFGGEKNIYEIPII